MMELLLDELPLGFPGVSPTKAASHYEALLVCLSHSNHRSGATLNVMFNQRSSQWLLLWHGRTTPQIHASWAELREATYFGAEGLAFMLVQPLTGYTVLRKARIGSHVDYFIGYSDDTLDFFEEIAAVEITGILRKESGNTMQRRLKRKQLQIARRALPMPVYIFVIEFASLSVQVVSYA